MVLISTKVTPVATWVQGVTKDLRAAFNALGESKHLYISHDPQSYYVDEGGKYGGNQDYWNALAPVLSSIDFIIIQYYNNPPNPATLPSSAVDHYERIVSGLFGGDASKVVFGICLTDCSGSGDLTVSQANSITKTLTQKYPSNFGGMALWATSADAGKGYQWSNGIKSTYSSVPTFLEMRGKQTSNVLEPTAH